MDMHLVANWVLLYFPFAKRRLLEYTVWDPKSQPLFTQSTYAVSECKISPNSINRASYTILKDESYISLPLSRLARTDQLGRTLAIVWIIPGTSSRVDGGRCAEQKGNQNYISAVRKPRPVLAMIAVYFYVGGFG
jgi:hypothetical protein